LRESNAHTTVCFLVFYYFKTSKTRESLKPESLEQPIYLGSGDRTLRNARLGRIAGFRHHGAGVDDVRSAEHGKRFRRSRRAAPADDHADHIEEAPDDHDLCYRFVVQFDDPDMPVPGAVKCHGFRLTGAGELPECRDIVPRALYPRGAFPFLIVIIVDLLDVMPAHMHEDHRHHDPEGDVGDPMRCGSHFRLNCQGSCTPLEPFLK